MTNRFDPIHPELRRGWKLIPKTTFRRGTLWLIRLLNNLMPKTKAPIGVRIETLHIQAEDRKRPIRLRVYRPETSDSPRPGLVWMHGGGMILGKPEIDDPFLLQFVQELGLVIVSVDYCLAPEHPFPAPLNDCYTALQWVHSQAQALNIYPDRIAIGGESAGGGLAATLAQMAHDRREVEPVFQMLVYPMLDDRSAIQPSPENPELLTWTQANNRFGWESYLRQPCGADNGAPYAVAARREDLSGLPPAWIGVGTLDLFYAEDVAYAQRLNDCGVECELVVLEGAFHGFDFLDPHIGLIQTWRKSQIEALRRRLLPKNLDH